MYSSGCFIKQCLKSSIIGQPHSINCRFPNQTILPNYSDVELCRLISVSCFDADEHLKYLLSQIQQTPKVMPKSFSHLR